MLGGSREDSPIGEVSGLKIGRYGVVQWRDKRNVLEDDNVGNFLRCILVH